MEWNKIKLETAGGRLHTWHGSTSIAKGACESLLTLHRKRISLCKPHATNLNLIQEPHRPTPNTTLHTTNEPPASSTLRRQSRGKPPNGLLKRAEPGAAPRLRTTSDSIWEFEGVILGGPVIY